jgi:hypothetical protein
MKRFAATVLIAALLSTSALSGARAEGTGEIPVDRVILSTSGLANFVHKMQVTDNATVEFPVRFEQVDDILKSLIIFDKKGRLGGVTLPGKKPLEQVFKDLPFSQGQLSNPMLLLNAYQGASITLKGGGNAAITGKIVQVAPEQVALDDGKTTTKHRISVMTPEGMRQALLEDLQSISFDDAKIRGEIARALDSIRENGTSERRMLTVSLPGEGARPVTLSYVVDAPLWKTAYRLVLPEGEGKDKKGLLQGWAVVENMTASDWNNVDMTLVSGNPVTFRQSLYESYYVPRPEIPVQVFGRVMPRTDSGAVSTASDMERRDFGNVVGGAPSAPAPAMMKSMSPRGERARMQAMEMSADSAVAYDGGASLAGGGYGGMSNVAQAASAAQSAEATTQVLFRFPDRFSLKSGQSMMLPFVSREVPMERVALYQPDTHPRHPLAAVEMKNDGDTGLPPGVLTLYEESALLKGTSFVGDANLPVVARGDKRMVSYALDSKTTIDREQKSRATEGRISVAQGIMRTAMTTRQETVYTIKAPEKEERTVVIEHPRMGDYQIVSPDPKDVEVTETHYRVRVPVKAGEKKTFSVVLEHQGWQSYTIANFSTQQLVAYATSRGQIDAGARKAFARMAEVRKSIDETDRKSQELERQRSTIFQDQQRVRENLRSLSGTSDVQQRYLKKLNEQEDQISKIDAMRDQLALQRQKLEGDLNKMISELSF